MLISGFIKALEHEGLSPTTWMASVMAMWQTLEIRSTGADVDTEDIKKGQ